MNNEIGSKNTDSTIVDGMTTRGVYVKPELITLSVEFAAGKAVTSAVEEGTFAGSS